MGKNSAIEWTDHTFNPWWGCVRVSPGCAHCYADTWAKRYGFNLWRRNGERRTMSAEHWRQPHKWNAEALTQKQRMRVFCASMADVFESHPALVAPRKQLFEVIERTPMLDWLMLTKRPQNMIQMAPWRDRWPDNIWAMTSVESQDIADVRIPALLDVPAAVRGLSVEPLLAPVDLGRWLHKGQINWVIVGGESGPGARPMERAWVVSLRDQCRKARVPFFFKQWGGIRKSETGRELDGVTWSEFPRGVVAA